jgi:hypothetical protein
MVSKQYRNAEGLLIAAERGAAAAGKIKALVPQGKRILIL